MKVPKPDKQHREAIEHGRSLRASVPRSSHATWKPAPGRRDPVATIIESSKNRIPALVPLRYGRMSASPFALMRGSAAVMAGDVATLPITGIRVQACGDAHLGNFGAFASPERRLLFDLTDFDETLAAPWEFDLKRLAVSFTLVAREKGCSDARARQITAHMVHSYREHLLQYAGMAPLDVWYAIIDSELLIRTAPDEATRERRIAFEKKTRKRTGDSLLGKLIGHDGQYWRFVNKPPVISRFRENSKLLRTFRKVLEKYPYTLSDDRRVLLSRYDLCDIAFKVVGVGSVGTRCAVALYISGTGDRLVLQVKEAVQSVLAKYAGQHTFRHEGRRVVVGQRLMQCASDIFLGWGDDGEGRDFYVRQLRDMKGSVPLEDLQGPVLYNFAGMCGWALARAHAKAGDGARLAGYLGRSDRIDKAIAAFAQGYSNQVEKDYALFMKAIKSGRIPVEREEPSK
jgi:uncharacterized protein (DUF2252 family)